jgi:hypothetical protein
VAAVLGWEIGAPALACASVVTALALYWSLTGADEHAETDDSLRHHLAHARRRNEPVDLLVLRVDGNSANAIRIRATLRVTDSVYLTRRGTGWEVQAMVDCGQLDREALRARLSEVAGFPLQIGWARFPDDGYTLAVLVAHARAGLGITAVPAAWATDPEPVSDLLIGPASGAQAQVVAK